MAKPHNKVNPIFLKSGLVLVILLILVVIAARFIQVPYALVETYQEIEAYNTNETYTENETRLVSVPVERTESYTSDVPVDVPQVSSLLDPKPGGLYGGSLCKFAPYNYSVEYIYSIPLEFNKYDPISWIGYRGKDNTYRQGVEICNHEKRRMNVDFRICNWVGDNKADCINRLDTRVRANSCEKRVLEWQTGFDETMHMTLEQIEVSQKLMCPNSAGEYTTHTYNPVLYGQEALAELTLETPVLKAESGSYHPSAKYPHGRVSLEEVLKRDYTVTQKKTEERTIVTYEERLQDVEVEKKRLVPMTRVVEKQRVVTTYRSLFDTAYGHIVDFFAEAAG